MRRKSNDVTIEKYNNAGYLQLVLIQQDVMQVVNYEPLQKHLNLMKSKKNVIKCRRRLKNILMARY